jgi:apolipoprotein N-acyltransferase
VGVSFITTRFPSGTKYTQEHRALANTLAPGGVSDLGEIVISPEGFQIDQLFKEPRSGSAQLFIGTTAESSGKTMYYHEYKTRTKYFDDKQILMPIGDYRLVWTDLLLKHTQGESWWNGYVKKFTLATSTGPGHLTDGIYHRDRSPLAILGTICSENISPYIYRDGVVNGATLFLNIASHAPFQGSSPLSRQTLAVNTARAIEGGRSFVTSTNYDSSMVISDKGELLVRTEPTAPIIYTRYNVPIKTYTTPYVRFGDFILIIALAIIVYTAARHKKSQN